MSDCIKVIPPEICEQFDSDVMAGKRPTFAILKETDIWSLRDDPNVGVQNDYIWLEFQNPDQLSSTQLEILKNWIALPGTPLYFNLNNDYSVILSAVLGLAIEYSAYPYLTGTITQDHPIKTDVAYLQLKCADSIKDGLPRDSNIAISTTRGACLGFFSYGERLIYFDFLDSFSGRDLLRFLLNLRQWRVGLTVPGAADTSIRGPVRRQPGIDVLVMQNGDVISGQLLTSSLQLDSAFGVLVLNIRDIYEIAILDSSTYQCRIRFRNGDIIYGALLDTTIQFTLAVTQQVLSIPLKDIKYIYLGGSS